MRFVMLNSVHEVHNYSRQARSLGKKIGLVPTMGYLHEGHLSLVREIKKHCDLVVVSIFVNPTQFSPNEDLDSYPRDLDRDIKLLEKEGVNAVFYPQPEEIYPANFSTYVDVEELNKRFEGTTRPTHFRGVTTVVSILFNAVSPNVAVFGQKDAQQAAVIKKMVKDLKFDIDIIVAPIIREENGLAMSSRNIYLTEEERDDATILFRALRHAKFLVDQGERSAAEIKKHMKEMINAINSSELDYVAVVESELFLEVDELEEGSDYFILVACRFGKARLIDNFLISL